MPKAADPPGRDVAAEPLVEAGTSEMRDAARGSSTACRIDYAA